MSDRKVMFTDPWLKALKPGPRPVEYLLAATARLRLLRLSPTRAADEHLPRRIGHPTWAGHPGHAGGSAPVGASISALAAHRPQSCSSPRRGNRSRSSLNAAGWGTPTTAAAVGTRASSGKAGAVGSARAIRHADAFGGVE